MLLLGTLYVRFCDEAGQNPLNRLIIVWKVCLLYNLLLLSAKL